MGEQGFLGQLQQQREEINLRVIKRLFARETGDPSLTVSGYTLVVPQVSVYRADGERWRRLQIMGPLFVLSLDGRDDPVLYLLNATCLENTTDFWVEFRKSIDRKWLKEGTNQLYLRVGAVDLMIATNSEADAQALAEALDAEAKPKELPVRDPTIAHALRMMAYW